MKIGIWIPSVRGLARPDVIRRSLVLAEERVPGVAELSLIFVDRQAITDLNERFLGGPGPTDVLAFPMAADVVKCQLKPITQSDYKVTFTPEELGRLRPVFPAGVCDWSKPGAEQQKLAGTWQTFVPRSSGGTGAP